MEEETLPAFGHLWLCEAGEFTAVLYWVGLGRGLRSRLGTGAW